VVGSSVKPWLVKETNNVMARVEGRGERRAPGR
jgi:hypothetical protein